MINLPMELKQVQMQFEMPTATLLVAVVAIGIVAAPAPGYGGGGLSKKIFRLVNIPAINWYCVLEDLQRELVLPMT